MKKSCFYIGFVIMFATIFKLFFYEDLKLWIDATMVVIWLLYTIYYKIDSRISYSLALLSLSPIIFFSLLGKFQYAETSSKVTLFLIVLAVSHEGVTKLTKVRQSVGVGAFIKRAIIEAKSIWKVT